MPEAPITYAAHLWVGAAYLPLDPKQAKHAERRGSVRMGEAAKVEVLEVTCGRCRRPYSEVVDTPCIVTSALHGGPIGERKKRGSEDDEDMPVAVGLG